MSLSPESNTEVPTPIMTDLQDIASMIQINEEATVSRTVMHAEGVRLVLFSFDKDEILSEHTAAMPVILHTLEGALEIEADGRTVVLKPGDDVVISIMEHHSNIIPWQQICAQTGARLVYLRMNDAFEITQEELESKITERAKIVSVTQVSNVLGVSNDISAIARRAHAMGAYMVVDAAQSAPHLPVDVRTLDCDLLAFSAHKMCGPMGIGILWGKADILNRMPPFLTGGEMIDSVTETGAVWAPIPEKFEAGTQDGAGICATGEAIAYLEGLGMANIERREALLARHLTERLNELDFIDIIGPQDGARHVGAVSFNVRGVHPHDVSSILDMDNVCIRAGHHCAEPLLTELGQSSTCRASVAFYNDASDIDQLVSGLARVWSIFNGN